MTRPIWVLMHRYAGLSMTVFLIIVGLTGSLLAFLNEINHFLSPHLFPNSKAESPLKPGELALIAQALHPEAEIKTVFLNASGSAMIGCEPRIDPASGKPYTLDFNQIFLDAGTGRELGRRLVGGLPSGVDNLMPFLYRLHYNLSLKRPGGIVLGIVALIWTLDCFIAFYLTLPARRKKPPEPALQKSRRFWQRWQPAWSIKWRAGATRVNFDLHRAGGLWLWLLLLVFAWSSVGFNLHKEVYLPVMRVFFDLPAETSESNETIPDLTRQTLGWHEAQATAERLMQVQAESHGFTIIEPIALYRQLNRDRYHYRVRSSLDIKGQNGATIVEFDIRDGHLLYVYLPSGQHTGRTVTQWLFALHEANVFGLPYRILVGVLGLVIVMLSVTGVIIWLKKHRAKSHVARGRLG